MAYNPQIEYRGDRYLFQGISDFGRAAGVAIREYRDNQRDSRAADAALETLVKSVSPWIEAGKIPAGLAEEMGNLGKFSSLSTRAKQAKLGQYVSSLQLLMEEADRRERSVDRVDAASLRRSMFELQRADADRRTRREDATSKAVLGVAPLLDMPSDQANGAMGPALVGALRDNPEADAMAVLDAMTRANRGIGAREPRMTDANEALQPFDVNGLSGVYNRITSKTSVRPQPRSNSRLAPEDRRSLELARIQRNGLMTRLAEVESQLSRGNKRTGPDWLWGQSFEEQADDLRRQIEVQDRQIAEISGAGDSPDAPPVDPGGGSPQPSGDDEQRAAMEAIRQGADPAAVARRFRERTGRDLL